MSGALAALLCACSLAPPYVAPKLDQDVAQSKEAGDWAPAAPADDQPRPEWWQTFGDPKLDELQQQLHAGNPDLRGAFARFREARAVAGEARSQQYPQLNANASAIRGRASVKVVTAIPPRSPPSCPAPRGRRRHVVPPRCSARRSCSIGRRSYRRW